MCIACWFNAYSIIKRVSFSTTFVETISGLEEDSVLNSISPVEFSSRHPLCSLKHNRPCKVEGFQGGYRTSKSTVRTELWRCFLPSDFSSGLVNPRETQAFGDYLLKRVCSHMLPCTQDDKNGMLLHLFDLHSNTRSQVGPWFPFSRSVNLRD